MTRILTAAVIIALLLGVLALPWQVFVVVVAIVAFLGWREYVALVARTGTAPVAAPGALLTLGLVVSFAAARGDAPLLALLAAFLLALLAVLREHWADSGAVIPALSATLAGVVWLGLLLGCQVRLRMADHGSIWLILLYASVALGDAAAYYGGSTLGRRKLAPRLSPNKTVEGALFGLAGSVAAALALAPRLPGLSLPQAAVLGVTLGVVGQGGDLMESALKRAAGVKDSSGLLPGHGGVLDRIDAHLPAGGLLYLAIAAGWLA